MKKISDQRRLNCDALVYTYISLGWLGLGTATIDEQFYRLVVFLTFSFSLVCVIWLARASIRAGRTASATITAQRTGTPSTCRAVSVKSLGLYRKQINGMMS